MPHAEPIYRSLRTRKQAARILNVSESSVKRLVTNGDLECIKINSLVRFRDEDLAAFIESRRRGGKVA